MKSVFLVLGGLWVSSFAVAQEELPTTSEIPAIRNVVIVQEAGCGAPAPIGHELPCPTTNRVSFEVETTGACDQFTTEIDDGVEGETYLTIIKQTVPNCGLPQHAPMPVGQVLFLADVLQGKVRLGNPVLVETHFRQ